MSAINLVFPHQLFEDSPLLTNGNRIYLIEEYLFFSQYKFHKQKLVFHRASMKFYESYLKSLGLEVTYVSATDNTHDVRKCISDLKNVSEIHVVNPVDDWLERRLKKSCEKSSIKLEIHETHYFLNSEEDLESFFKPTKKKFYQTKFYKDERVRWNVLVDDKGNPEGGKWTYDVDNRKKYPKGKVRPAVHFPETDNIFKEAQSYVEKHFAHNYGEVVETSLYPYNFTESKKWLDQFLENRFHEFGVYEDAIVKEELILNHSILTPMLNSGLLTPQFVLDKALAFSKDKEVPLNSLEGFVRQIMGWREFIRGVYRAKGREERTTNYWGFDRKIPASFYDGTTGIEPIDSTIKKVLKTGYCHHIERLMILGNFMMLCEFDPDEVYKWFMEMFIDAYDWVMVTNVYGMSQFADGGLMATKPYISSSNYIMKMSNYKKGDWQEKWDALFWRFMNVNRDFFLKNPRLGMLIRTYDKMNQDKKDVLDQAAMDFFKRLDRDITR